MKRALGRGQPRAIERRESRRRSVDADRIEPENLRHGARHGVERHRQRGRHKPGAPAQVVNQSCIGEDLDRGRIARDECAAAPQPHAVDRCAPALLAAAIYRMLEQQHLHFALPAAPACGIRAGRQIRDKRRAERSFGRKGDEPRRMLDPREPACRFGGEKADAVVGEVRVEGCDERVGWFAERVFELGDGLHEFESTAGPASSGTRST